MKPLESIRAATLEAAVLVGLEGKAGSIEKDYFADVIAVEGDPLADSSVLTRV